MKLPSLACRVRLHLQVSPECRTIDTKLSDLGLLYAVVRWKLLFRQECPGGQDMQKGYLAVAPLFAGV
jgi:hypothetical protein